MYNYREEIVKDIKQYIEDNPNAVSLDPLLTDDNTSDYWYDIMWNEDCVTGNGSYYYASEEECEHYLTGNLQLAIDAANDFGVTMENLVKYARDGKIARYLDCTIRCDLLGECIDIALEELNN